MIFKSLAFSLWMWSRLSYNFQIPRNFWLIPFEKYVVKRFLFGLLAILVKIDNPIFKLNVAIGLLAFVGQGGVVCVNFDGHHIGW